MEFSGVPTAAIDTVAERLAHCADRWHLQLGQPFTVGSLSRVFPCVDAEGNQLVLKLCPPEAPAALESAALRLWMGRAAVGLRDWDAQAGALLLERLFPGMPLPPGRDEEAIRVAAGVLGDLHAVPVPPEHPFPAQVDALDSWLRRVRANAEPAAAGVPLIEQAREAARRLCETAGRAVLLHGDFIDKNLLLGPAGYVAIDPMPFLGDPCSDIGCFASYHPPARGIVANARALAERLGHDPDRADRWAAVYAVGEACETWRSDSDELQAWVNGEEATSLLAL